MKSLGCMKRMMATNECCCKNRAKKAGMTGCTGIQRLRTLTPHPRTPSRAVRRGGW